MDLKDKKVLVIGTGLSGIGSAELLVKKGAHVLLLEQNEKADRETIKKKFQETLTEEETASIEILIGDFPEEMIPELVIPSPAVPLDSPLLIRMKEAGVPVLSEIELGWRFEKGTSGNHRDKRENHDDNSGRGNHEGGSCGKKR